MIVKEIEHRPLYIRIMVDSNWDEMREVGRWCTQHQCGKQVGIRQFSFKTDEEVTMFRLKWETE